jgi:hypothetical protein
LKLLVAAILSVTMILSLSLVPVNAESPRSNLVISEGELRLGDVGGDGDLDFMTANFRASVDGTEPVNIRSITFPNILCAVPVITPNGQQANSMMPCVVEINECISEEEVPIEETFESNMESIPPNGKVPVIIDYEIGCTGGPDDTSDRTDGPLSSRIVNPVFVKL